MNLSTYIQIVFCFSFDSDERNDKYSNNVKKL